jgi:hypothetical protein
MQHETVKPWQDIDIEAAGLPSGPGKLHAVIKELNVTKAPRYQAKDGKTYCNIFVTDVCRAMGFAPSHWVDTAGNPAKAGLPHRELTANSMVDWFRNQGQRFGWDEVDRDTALDAAERGHLVVVAWQNPLRAHPGHVAIVLPEGTIAQAGAKNFVGYTIREGFGELPVVFFVQTRGGAHRP